jgi:RNA polymerase sigma factor (sigma-70 family)
MQVQELEDIYRYEFHIFLKVAQNNLSDEFWSKDVTQEAFIITLRHLDKIIDERHCRIFLTKVIKQRAYNLFKRNKIFGNIIQNIVYYSSIQYYEQQAMNKLDTYPLASKYISKIVHLSGRRQAMVKLFLKGLGPKEIAGEIGGTGNNVVQNLKRGINQLKEENPQIVKSIAQTTNIKRAHEAYMRKYSETFGKIKANILQLLSEGKSKEEICAELGVSRRYVGNVYSKKIRVENPEVSIRKTQREKAKRMFVLHSMGMTYHEIALVFDCSYVNAFRIIEREKEKNTDIIDSSADPWYTKVFDQFHKGDGRRFNNRRVSDETIREIKHLLKSGIPNKDIEAKFGISKTSLYKIKTGKIWGDII